MSEARIWYSRNTDQQNLPCECQNLIVLTEEFYREVLEHPIPTDLDAPAARPRVRGDSMITTFEIAMPKRPAGPEDPDQR